MGWVDADAHVVESPRTWDYLTASEQKYRPALFDPNDGTQRQNWVIDGKIRGLFRFAFTEEALVERSKRVGRQMTTSMATRDVANVGARLAHMDELGIDVQILYTSIFLDQCTERPEVDVALCGAYNRWMADVWKEGKGRLRWMCVLPFLSMPDAMDQLRFAKENGACGVFMRPIEGPRSVDDPYFFPFYEEASKLDLCIGLHQSNGNAHLVDMLANPDGTRDFFNQYRIFNVGAFFRLVSSGLPKTFPKLRVRLHRDGGVMDPVGGLRAAPPDGYRGQQAAGGPAARIQPVRDLPDRRRRAVSAATGRRRRVDDRHGLRTRGLLHGARGAHLAQGERRHQHGHAHEDRGRQPAGVLRPVGACAAVDPVGGRPAGRPYRLD